MRASFLRMIALAASLTLAPAAAFAAEWVTSGGKSCVSTCAAVGLGPVGSPGASGREDFLVCAAQGQGAGWRTGFVRGDRNVCVTAARDGVDRASQYRCLCDGVKAIVREERQPPRYGGIRVRQATYGGNCGARAGNATYAVASECDGRASCDYVVDYNRLGDPAEGCSKDFRVDFLCPGGFDAETTVAPEAGFGKTARLSCDAPRRGGLEVLSATYGGNCGARVGNATGHIAGLCNGQRQCRYTIDYRQIGDPITGCEKDYSVVYACDGRRQQATARAEAGFGSQVVLTCQ